MTVTVEVTTILTSHGGTAKVVMGDHTRAGYGHRRPHMLELNLFLEEQTSVNTSIPKQDMVRGEYMGVSHCVTHYDVDPNCTS